MASKNAEVLLYNMALAALLKDANLMERGREYASHAALNLGQAARDLRYPLSHPGADKTHHPGTRGHATASLLAHRIPSLASNLWFTALPPHLHHKPEELHGMPDEHSLREWFQLGYKPWEHGPRLEPQRHLPADERNPKEGS